MPDPIASVPTKRKPRAPRARPVSANGVNLTPWLGRDSALRRILRTETGSGAALFAAAVIALIWANLDGASYHQVWSTKLSVGFADSALSMDLRRWINSGLMSFFFLVVGLEARREFDIGEFRERPRIVLPILAGIGGMLGAIGLYLGFTAGRPSAAGWGVAMSTDTAFALGVLALLGKRVPDRLRGFILTVTVVDDIIGLAVIATAYTRHVNVMPLLVGFALLGVAVAGAWLRIRGGLRYFPVAAAAWLAFLQSGVDPIVVGLAAGLVTYAAPVSRTDLERATEVFRAFREQPTARLADRARTALRTALSPNDRLEQLWRPWTSYIIVPLFGLANAGIPVDRGFLSQAYASPITLGIIFGYLLGKPIGVTFASALVTTVTRGRLRPPVGWATVVGGGLIAGTGFTVSLLIATHAFAGRELNEATLGLLTSEVISALATWFFFQAVASLPTRLRLRALLGRSDVILDLADPVSSDRDHLRGPLHAKVTLVEYGDFECPYCGKAEPAIRKVLADFGDLLFVWRHLPLRRVHPHAQLAAEASEAAAAQGAFWEMHDLLLKRQDKLEFNDLVGYAAELGLDRERFAADLESGRWSARVASDVESADLSDVAGTPTFFINGQRLRGAYDVTSLKNAVQTALARAAVRAGKHEGRPAPAGRPEA